MTLFSEAKARKVVDLSTATSVGKVADYVVDAPKQRIAAFRLKKSAGSGNLIAWESITSFGTDAVTISDVSRISDADGDLEALTAKSNGFDGKQVLTTAGELLGTVSDLDFDPETGAVLAVTLGDVRIDGERLIATGSYAIIVQA